MVEKKETKSGFTFDWNNVNILTIPLNLWNFTQVEPHSCREFLTLNFGLDELMPKFDTIKPMMILPLVGNATATEEFASADGNENERVMLLKTLWMDTNTGNPWTRALKPATFWPTTHVSLIHRVAKTADPPTRAAVQLAPSYDLYPYPRPNNVMAVWPVCGALFG
jgi:hypothetical protein